MKRSQTSYLKKSKSKSTLVSHLYLVENKGMSWRCECKLNRHLAKVFDCLISYGTHTTRGCFPIFNVISSSSHIATFPSPSSKHHCHIFLYFPFSLNIYSYHFVFEFKWRNNNMIRPYSITIFKIWIKWNNDMTLEVYSWYLSYYFW